MSNSPTGEIDKEEFDFILQFTTNVFNKRIEDPLNPIYLAIRYEKIDELEKSLNLKDINKEFPYPIGCISHGFYMGYRRGYYFGSKKLTPRHSFGNYTYEYFYIERISEKETFDQDNGFGPSIEWTPLQLASALGNQKVVDYLIRKGAKEYIQDVTGRDSKMIASHNGVIIDFNSGKILKYFDNLKKECDLLFTFE